MIAKYRHVLAPLARSLRLMWQAAARLSVARVALLVIQGLLPLVALYLMKLIVDAVQVGLASGDPAASFPHVALLIAMAAGAGLLTAVVRSLAQLTGEAQTLVVTDHMHNLLHDQAIRVDLQYYEQADYYDALHRAQAQAAFRANRLVTGMAALLQNTVSLLGVAGLLVAFDPLVALVLMGAAVPGALFRLRHSRAIHKWERERTAAEREARYFGILLTENAHAKEVRIFNLGPLFIRRYRELRAWIRREKLRLVRRRMSGDLAGNGLAVIAMFAGFGFVAWRTLTGGLTLGDMVMYFGAFQRGQEFFRETLSSATLLYEDNLFLGYLYEFLDIEPKVAAPPQPVPPPRPLHRGIELRNVSFTYPSSGVQVLSGIDLVVRPGEHVALVGQNGSGKTTLVKLLCRLYDPTEGSITLDGVDLREMDPIELRREISVVFQDYARYNLTARENIAFGDAWSNPDDQRIRAAAQLAGADDLIAGLKQGYDSVLGHLFRHGVELSIGEWQKIAIARAFLRDAPIIVFDEPTSALDARAEYEVFERFHRLAEGRAAILISHRLSTVRMVDRIYVLEDGRIVEEGDHADLVGRGGTYAQLFETQARYYQ